MNTAPAPIAVIISNIIKVEGGYVNNPKDPGGETKYGITVKVARAHGYQGKMIDLTEQQAFDIYYADYVTGPRFDQVYDTGCEKLARELIDTGVNMGPSVAAKFLQRWLTALNNEGTLYPDLAADGMIGPRTISALKSLIEARGPAQVDTALTSACNSLQAARYLELAEGKKSNETFLWGWLINRAVL